MEQIISSGNHWRSESHAAKHDHIMSDEAFLDTEHHFQQAFATTDPVPLLMELLKERPTYLAIHDLVVYYTEAVKEDPSHGQSLASALTRLRDSPNAPTFEADTLFSFIDHKLADQHFKVIYSSSEVKEYGSKNTYLLDSLLSGLLLKHQLISTSDQYAAIGNSLDAPRGSGKSQVLVVGTCIQLLLCGSLIMTEAAGSYRKKPEVVALKLKAQKQAGTVKDPHTVKVLEVCNLFHEEIG